MGNINRTMRSQELQVTHEAGIFFCKCRGRKKKQSKGIEILIHTPFIIRTLAIEVDFMN